MNELFDALLFFLPAGVANMTPVLANKIPLLNRWKTPIDFGKSWRGKRLLGANKTWRGLVYGAFMGAFTGWIVYLFYPGLVYQFVPAPVSALSTAVLMGAALGLGALVGDAVESFFKRQVGIKPGSAWFPFDQIDYIIGGLVFVWPLAHLTWGKVGYIFLLYFGLHLSVSYIGYLLKFKDKPI